MPRVLVVGGGYAGVSAATALAEAGLAVELLESRGFLGGRVYSTQATGSFPAQADNGPHLFMGCYQETLRLFSRLGEEDPLRWIDPLRLSWLLPGGAKTVLNCPSLPAPLHLAAGLLTSDAFPFQEKLRLAKALFAFSKRPFQAGAGKTVEQFLDSRQQGPAARERFWGPLTRAVMNVPTRLAPIEGLGEVLHRVFFGRRLDSAFGIARKPLSELAFPRVEGYLASRGGKVSLHEGVAAFDLGGRTPRITTHSGLTLEADALVWAVPPQSLAGLWPKESWTFADHFQDLGKSPIVSVHVILKEKVFLGDFLGLSGAAFEWVFNRNENWGWKGEDLFHRGDAESAEKIQDKKEKKAPGNIGDEPAGNHPDPKNFQYLSFTASAAENLARKKDPELLGLALQELLERLPAGQELKVLHSKVTREMAATFAWTPATGPLRPACETPFPGVFLAGDWTDTGLPATIEGACFSGHKAAEAAARYLAGH